MSEFSFAQMCFVALQVVVKGAVASSVMQRTYDNFSRHGGYD